MFDFKNHATYTPRLLVARPQCCTSSTHYKSRNKLRAKFKRKRVTKNCLWHSVTDRCVKTDLTKFPALPKFNESP